ncbi:hypothetical protein Sjap_005033 [Stephania japonica]|uniref:D-isomer specific 2-hydroxyacid dehydrogenase catalytic domain-containing protein n=1 Tax=Stephania japonica TaxID=461633 RepID=A0AAP0K4B5_9MAGN
MAEPPPRHQVLLLRPFPFISGYEEAFLSKFEPLKPSESTEPLHSFLITHAQSVKALICSAMKPLPAEILRCLPSLELVVTSSVGIDHIDLEECRSRGIAVANAGDSYSDDVADYAVGLLLDVLRRVSGGDRYVRGGLWAVKGKYPLGSKLKAGIMGRWNMHCVLTGCDVHAD